MCWDSRPPGLNRLPAITAIGGALAVVAWTIQDKTLWNTMLDGIRWNRKRHNCVLGCRRRWVMNERNLSEGGLLPTKIHTLWQKMWILKSCSFQGRFQPSIMFTFKLTRPWASPRSCAWSWSWGRRWRGSWRGLPPWWGGAWPWPPATPSSAHPSHSLPSHYPLTTLYCS